MDPSTKIKQRTYTLDRVSAESKPGTPKNVNKKIAASANEVLASGKSLDRPQEPKIKDRTWNNLVNHPRWNARILPKA